MLTDSPEVAHNVNSPQDNMGENMKDDVGDQNPGHHPLHLRLFQLNGKEHCHYCCKYQDSNTGIGAHL